MGVYEDRIAYSKRLTAYVHTLKLNSNKDKLKDFSEMRRIPMKELEESDIFFIGDMAEMIRPEFIDEIGQFGVISATNNKPIFHNRWVIPIKNQYGLVENLVGYSRDADERYVYGTANYYDRQNTLYGLENIELAYELGWAILVEGITDAMRVRSLGYKNTFAACGTMKSEHKMKVLDRCRYGIIRIPDRDSAGRKTKGHWTTSRYVTLNVPVTYKDVDETVYELYENDGENWVRAYIDSCVQWLKQKEHRGVKCPTIEATMY